MALIDEAKAILNTKEGKAMLDMIAFAEGTAGVSKNGYDIMQNFYQLVEWNNNYSGKHEGDKWKKTTGGTSAFGRYQFLEGTWKSISKKLYGEENSVINKNNQNLFAAHLINNRTKKSNKCSGITIPKPPSLTSLNKNNFHLYLDSLAPEWASLPLSLKGGKGCYSNQGGKLSSNKLFGIYQQALAKY
jgi:muramidase (phage lysozyme)